MSVSKDEILEAIANMTVMEVVGDVEHVRVPGAVRRLGAEVAKFGTVGAVAIVSIPPPRVEDVMRWEACRAYSGVSIHAPRVEGD